MANPQKENGYTTIANELLEAIYCGKFSPTEFKMLLFILRYTYGFNRKVARLSNSFISGGTKIHEVAVSRAITSLIRDNVLIEQEKHYQTRQDIRKKKNKRKRSKRKQDRTCSPGGRWKKE